MTKFYGGRKLARIKEGPFSPHLPIPQLISIYYSHTFVKKKRRGVNLLPHCYVALRRDYRACFCLPPGFYMFRERTVKAAAVPLCVLSESPAEGSRGHTLCVFFFSRSILCCNWAWHHGSTDNKAGIHVFFSCCERIRQLQGCRRRFVVKEMLRFCA